MKRAIIPLLLIFTVSVASAQKYAYLGTTFSQSKFINFWDSQPDKLFTVPAPGISIGYRNDKGDNLYWNLDLNLINERHNFKKLNTFRQTSLSSISFEAGYKIKYGKFLFRLYPQLNLGINQLTIMDFIYYDQAYVYRVAGYFISPGLGAEIDRFISDNKYISLRINNIWHYRTSNLFSPFTNSLWGNTLSIQLGLNIKL